MFAFEHGLSPSERNDVEQALLSSLSFGQPQRRHWLAWVVHATEIGYDYVGLEYWPIFQKRTPRWRDGNDSRDWIRQQFKRFTREFGGVEPSGAWANQFSIICWPITHSVLPQDLQNQFVISLGRLQSRYTSALLRNPALLGAAIESVSSDAGARFRQFIKNTELVGLIASALLLQGESLEFEVLEHATLQRIVGDLERRRHAKDLLDRARARARRTIAMHGLGHGEVGRQGAGTRDSSALLTQLGLEPTLTLRLGSDGSWQGWLRLPDMSSAAPMLPDEVRRTLLESRFRIPSGRRTKPWAAGALMFAMPDIEFARWPEPSTPLVQFEDSGSAAEALLGSKLSIGDSSTWLFRLRDDGDARLVKGRTIRGGAEYLVVGEEGSLVGLPLLDESAEFGGARVARLWPDALESDELDTLCERLALTQATTLRVWPVGMPAAEWDGEGNVEWVTLQPKLVAVTADCADGVLELRNARFGTEPLRVPLVSGRPAFINLEPIEVGEHNFELSLTCGTSVQAGRLRVVVREPTTGTSQRALPLVITPSPRSPSLEEFWDGRFSLDLDGPEGHLVRVKAALFRDGVSSALIERTLPSVHLPVDTAAWREHVERHFIDNSGVQNRYDEADSCLLAVDGRELGAREFRMEREQTPLRWVLSRDSKDYCLELRDDTGRLELPAVVWYSFDKPDVAVGVDSAPLQNSRCLEPEGGLYVARVDGFMCSAIVPLQAHNLQDLNCRPSLSYHNRSARDVMGLLGHAASWHSARIPGQLAAQYPMWRVLASFEYKLVEIIVGSNWMHAEQHYQRQRSASSWDALTEAVATTQHDRPLVGVLKVDGTLARGVPRERCERLTSLISQALAFSPTAIPKAQLMERMEFALRFASSPQTVGAWAGDRLESLLTDLLESPMHLRAARWLVLATDAVAERFGDGQPRTDWEW